MNRQQSTSISGKHHPENHKGEGSTPRSLRVRRHSLLRCARRRPELRFSPRSCGERDTTGDTALQGLRSRSDVEFGGLDPLPEIGAGRLLQIARIHGLEAAERDEVVLVVVRGQALYESLFGDE